MKTLTIHIRTGTTGKVLMYGRDRCFVKLAGVLAWIPTSELKFN